MEILHSKFILGKDCSLLKKLTGDVLIYAIPHGNKRGADSALVSGARAGNAQVLELPVMLSRSFEGLILQNRSKYNLQITSFQLPEAPVAPSPKYLSISQHLGWPWTLLSHREASKGDEEQWLSVCCYFLEHFPLSRRAGEAPEV